LIYDLDGDYVAGQGAGTVGFFWSKDEYAQSTLDENYGVDGYKTNKAEMFYVDAYFSDYSADDMVTTLVHEYQHMINFNVKAMRLKKEYSTWYDEMLSMLAEDVIDPLIGIGIDNSTHPIKSRFFFFLDGYYRFGPTEWRTESFEENFVSYANVYGFGAYLVRNFGGVQFLKEISANNFVDERSISKALASCSGNKTGVTNFLQAISRYGEALVYNNTSGATLSFNKTAAGTISGESYTFHGLDIFNMPRYDWSTGTSGNTGPSILPASVPIDMPPNGVAIFQASEWKNKTGALQITLKKPANSNIDFYLMEK
jgi:hypothetical protein